MIVKRKGFSLLEIVIAFSLVTACALSVIQIFRQGGMKGESFSSEHFTAMFLSQKVLEDINHRLSENPHYFSELIHTATGEKKPIIDGKHPFFQLLENTTNFTSLDPKEDKPITADSGSIYHQLRNFQAQIDTGFVVDPSTGQPFQNLVEVRIRIFWKDQIGNELNYSVSQMVSGVNEDTFADQVKTHLPPFSDDKIGKVLWDALASDIAPNPPTLAAFLSRNSGDPRVVKAIGSLLYAVTTAASSSDTINQSVKVAETKRDLALSAADVKTKISAAIWQEKIGDYYEKKSSLLFSLLGSLEPSLAFIASRTLTTGDLGSILSSHIYRLRNATIEGIALNDRLSLNIDATEEAFAQLLNAPYRALIAPRKVTPATRRMLDIKKLQVLFESFEVGATARLTELQKSVQSLQTAFEGREPAFLEYLSHEKELSNSFATIRAHYGETDGLTALTGRILQITGQCEAIEDDLHYLAVTEGASDVSGGTSTGTGTGFSSGNGSGISSATGSGSSTGTGTGADTSHGGQSNPGFSVHSPSQSQW
ncbi:MAG: hypothetical protein WA705_18105 [Candidatus Ozemobacteraceae bacterium]